jgi:phosphoglycerol transferase MdoB-like AlkP superfamily enzyme
MKGFKNKLLFFLSYFLLWIGYFVFSRTIFLLFYYDKTLQLGLETTLKTFLYGFRLDLSFASYLSVIPFFLILFSFFIKPVKIHKTIKWYSYLLLILINLLLIIDVGLYKTWGVRIDSTLLTYIDTPELMLASISAFQMIMGSVVWVVISIVFIKLFKSVISKRMVTIDKESWFQLPVLFFITIALIIPIRGGLQLIPINQSNVYFSNKMFANHAAINFVWNFFNTLSFKIEDENPYKIFDDLTAQKIIDKNRAPLLIATNDSILNTQKPNIILLIWEGLTAKVVGPLGGEIEVTENLNKLVKEGIFFTNFYANGDRTDKGIPSILSGYYPQPIRKIMRMPNKSRSLPMLPQKMIDLGYKTSFYYGGDTNFGNMNTYLRNAGISNIIEGREFDKKNWNSKWGVHDHVFMERFTKDLSQPQIEPFFKIALTLSSHEPYEFPQTFKFGRDTEVNKFRSSHAYTDKVIGEFIKKAKTQSWWENTLIIIVADHGHGLPERKGYFNAPSRFKIPMLWLGGALAKRDTIVSTISAQTDLSFTLLQILNQDPSDFKWGKNIFNNSESQYAHYIFNKGFGIIDKNGIYVYDFISNKAFEEKGTSTKKLDSLGKAISQNSYQDFLDRK